MTEQAAMDLLDSERDTFTADETFSMLDALGIEPPARLLESFADLDGTQDEFDRESLDYVVSVSRSGNPGWLSAE